MALLAEIAVPVPLSHAFTYAVPAALAASVRPGARVVCELREAPPRRRGAARGGARAAARAHQRQAPRGARRRRAGAPRGAARVPGPGSAPTTSRPSARCCGWRCRRWSASRCASLEAQGELSIGATSRQVGGRKVALRAAHGRHRGPGHAARPDGGGARAPAASRRAAGGAAPGSLRGRARGREEARRARPRRRGAARAAARSLLRRPARARSASRAQRLAGRRRRAHHRGHGWRGRPRRARGPSSSSASPDRARPRCTCAPSPRASSAGEGALVMVPEIALTPQLVSRFRARFGDALAVLHSGLADADRHAMWTRLRRGEVARGHRRPLRALRARARSRAHHRRRGARLLVQAGGGRSLPRPRHGPAARAPPRRRGGARIGHAVARVGRARAPRQARPSSASPTAPSPRPRCPRSTLSICAATAPGPAAIGCSRSPSTAPSSRPWPRASRPSSSSTAAASPPASSARRAAPSDLRGRARSRSPTTAAAPARGACAATTATSRARCPPPAPPARAPALELEGLGTEQLEDTVAAAFPTARVARLDRDVAGGAKGRGDPRRACARARSTSWWARRW